jgi:NTE family protein
MTTAFVLGGGASLGAVEVGMLYALTERGIRPDLLIGTSAGALNAAYVAGRGTGRQALDDLAATWQHLRRQDVFALDPLRHLRAVTGSRPSLCSDRNLRRLIASRLSYHDLEEATIPVHLVTTDLLSGQEILLSTGDALSAVLASAAVPGVLPTVQRGVCTWWTGASQTTLRCLRQWPWAPTKCGCCRPVTPVPCRTHRPPPWPPRCRRC